MWGLQKLPRIVGRLSAVNPVKHEKPEFMGRASLLSGHECSAHVFTTAPDWTLASYEGENGLVRAPGMGNIAGKRRGDLSRWSDSQKL